MADSASKVSRADLLAHAQAAILELSGDYEIQLAADMSELKLVWDGTDHAQPERDNIRTLFDIAHNLKGQAGSFGYELVTSISGSLCDLIRDDPDCSERIDAIQRHIRVLDQVVTKSVKGDGGETGAKIVAQLKQLFPTD